MKVQDRNLNLDVDYKLGSVPNRRFRRKQQHRTKVRGPGNCAGSPLVCVQLNVGL